MFTSRTRSVTVRPRHFQTESCRASSRSRRSNARLHRRRAPRVARLPRLTHPRSSPSLTPTETLQDLLRFLRRDASKDRPVACALHAWNVLEKDALPLLLTYHGLDHEALSLDAIKLLVFLTLPPDSDAANVIDQKRKSRAALEAMVRFRATRGDVFAVLFSRHPNLPELRVRIERDDAFIADLQLAVLDVVARRDKYAELLRAAA